MTVQKRTVAVLVLLSAISGRGQQQAASSASNTLAALLQQEEDVYNAGDAKAFAAWMDAHLREDFGCLMTDGRLFDKQQMRDSYVSRMKAGTYRERVTDRTIKIIGNTAVVTGIANSSYQPNDGPSRHSRFRYMEVWVNQNGRWKQAACAGAFIVERPKAAPAPAAN